MDIGSILRTQGADEAVLVGKATRYGHFTVHNLEVAEQHNYFVGDRGGVLVHNAQCVEIVKKEVIAKGKRLKNRFKLEELCGGAADLWKKMKGWTAAGVEWHWYEFEGHRSGWKLGGLNLPDPEDLCE